MANEDAEFLLSRFEKQTNNEAINKCIVHILRKAELIIERDGQANRALTILKSLALELEQYKLD